MQQEWNLMFSQLPSNTRSGWLQGWQQVGDEKGYWWARRSGSSTWYQSIRKGNQLPQGNVLTPPLQHCGWTVPMCWWGLAFPAHHYNPCVLTKRISTCVIQSRFYCREAESRVSEVGVKWDYEESKAHRKGAKDATDTSSQRYLNLVFQPPSIFHTCLQC